MVMEVIVIVEVVAVVVVAIKQSECTNKTPLDAIPSPSLSGSSPSHAGSPINQVIPAIIKQYK